ncbi:hypothetical protein HCU64_06390 [Methylobacterium sp. C25]|uniref:hypothetical protein n=1 Tax=Methylobacterium sp. C25 TaxID=2721622 RepID=UPI001F32BB90|nr:hypothetical protein [Methylobacterium sp. C25]MCE4223374.1 hypothetical protein [Methylobacterium sp. C25]
MTLRWRHTWPEKGEDFVLLRERDPAADPEPEHIGRIHSHAKSQYAERRRGWSWSLTCATKFVGIPKPAFAASGFEGTKQEAADALKAAWAQEEAWRAEALATVDFSGMPPNVERCLRHGQPTPAKWSRLTDGQG